MNVRQLLSVDEPLPPQPRSFWMVRLLVTGLIAAAGATVQVVDLPFSFDFVPWIQSTAPQPQDKPPENAAPQDTLPQDTSPDGVGLNLPADPQPRQNLPNDQAPRPIVAAKDVLRARRVDGGHLPLIARLPRFSLDVESDAGTFDARYLGGLAAVVLIGSSLVAIRRRKRGTPVRGARSHGALLHDTAQREAPRRDTSRYDTPQHGGASTSFGGAKVEELRREPRRRTRFREGKLFDPETRSWIECTISDRSAHGARIRIERTLKNFRSYRLLVDEAEQMTYEARVAWCNGKEIGLEFRKAYPSAKRGKLSVVNA